MIRYRLKCAEGHGFDSWFRSAEAYDKLAAAQMVGCAICGSTQVEKSPMAPRLRSARQEGAGAERPTTPLAEPASAIEARIAALKRFIEKTSLDVGTDFATEVRQMHEGQKPHRPVHGQAKLSEARALIEDGVPIAPLPFIPSRKTN